MIPNSVGTIGSVKVGGAFRGLAGSADTYYIYAPTLNKVSVDKATYNHDQLTTAVHFDAIGKAVALSVIAST